MDQSVVKSNKVDNKLDAGPLDVEVTESNVIAVEVLYRDKIKSILMCLFFL